MVFNYVKYFSNPSFYEWPLLKAVNSDNVSIKCIVDSPHHGEKEYSTFELVKYIAQ